MKCDCFYCVSVSVGHYCRLSVIFDRGNNMILNLKETERETRRVMWYYGTAFTLVFLICTSLYFCFKQSTVEPTREARIMYARQLNLETPATASVYVDCDEDTVLIIKGTWKVARYNAFIERMQRDMFLLCKMGFTEYHIISLCLTNEKGEEFCSSQDQEIPLMCPKPESRARELGK